MSERADKLLWSPPVIVRMCVIFGGAAFFFSVSMMMDPSRSRASSILPQTQNQDATPPQNVPTRTISDLKRLSPFAPTNIAPTNGDSSDPASINDAQSLTVNPESPPAADDRGNVLLGALRGSKSHAIWIYSGAVGPLYTIIDRTSNRVIARAIEADELYRQYPELQAENLQLVPFNIKSGQLMLADPDSQRLP
ncbi:MAG: hypothetical protein IBJ18_08110 [Phycisphaerales bacterium]|nr:hypothetical protein [Phycisphaerales bacterium]